MLVETGENPFVKAAEEAQKAWTELWTELGLGAELRDQYLNAYSLVQDCKAKAEKWAADGAALAGGDATKLGVIARVVVLSRSNLYGPFYKLRP